MSGHVCTLYSGPGLSPTCLEGSIVDACPTEGALGHCFETLSAGGVGESAMTTYYSDGMVDAGTAQAQCQSFAGATWVGN